MKFAKKLCFFAENFKNRIFSRQIWREKMPCCSDEQHGRRISEEMRRLAKCTIVHFARRRISSEMRRPCCSSEQHGIFSRQIWREKIRFLKFSAKKHSFFANFKNRPLCDFQIAERWQNFAPAKFCPIFAQICAKIGQNFAGAKFCHRSAI